MPYELKLKSNGGGGRKRANSERRHFYIRISAVNLEMGEGPNSTIMQLKRINQSIFFIFIMNSIGFIIISISVKIISILYSIKLVTYKKCFCLYKS